MKIIQVKTGIIEIPPKNWGAVEKVIWEYLKVLDFMGWETELKWTDEVENDDNQIVHVHMANLANYLHNKKIPYVFSLHDHHVEYWGKDSNCYKENYNAIKNSKLTFVHAKHLIKYFDDLPQIVYLPHGVNTKDYKFFDRSERVRQRPHKLVMMGNNGVGGDNLSDRKGFLIGIEAAKYLNLEIGIICPSKGNKEFFKHWNVNYDNLTIHYDLDYESSIEKLSEYDIFLHPSNLEAGHPNLTLVESISMGIPIVGTLDNFDLKGMIRVNRNLDDLINGIKIAINKYDTLVQLCYNYRDDISWEIVVSKMVQEYKEFFKISEKTQLINNYNNIKIKNLDKKDGIRGYVSNFKNGVAFLKISVFSENDTAYFKDCLTNEIIYYAKSSYEPSFWAKVPFHSDRFIDWEIKVKCGNNLIYKDKLDLKNKRILLINDDLHFNDIYVYLLKFQKQNECFITVKKDGDYLNGLCFDNQADSNEFYYTLTDKQLIDYFNNKIKISDKHLFILNSYALGDTIVFMTYAQKWAEINDKYVDISINYTEIFDPKDYPNFNILNKKNDLNLNEYSDISNFNYLFNMNLMEGFSYQMGLKYEEIRPKLKDIKKDEPPIKFKYVCMSTQSTNQCKYWNYPDGWNILCKKLIDNGFIPICLDLHEIFGIDGNWNYSPNNAVKKTGMSLDDILYYLKYCEFFIGLSSGLSWIAWALGKKVVMISGVTKPENEFKQNNIRIHNSNVCNGCFNKTLSYEFDPGDWMWCPVHKNTKRQFECTSNITPDDIMLEIKNKILYDNSIL